MKQSVSLLIVAIVALCGMTSCNIMQQKPTKHVKQERHAEPTNAIYHWKGVFNPTEEEIGFMHQHRVERLYIRMFDIATDYNNHEQRIEAVPIATTRFDGKIPVGVEVIPTTYITVEALKAMEGEEYRYAVLIVERMLAMASYNNCGKINEIQYDCDWTPSTRHIFFELCNITRNILHAEGRELSVTVRLHQMREEAPKADRGVLMLYNTGNIRNKETRNSILDINDIRPYLRIIDYPLPLDYAYPTFSWGVKFKDGEFERLVKNYQEETLGEGEEMRIERATAQEIIEVKNAVERSFGKTYQNNIIYHLDINELNTYSYDEIAEIYSRN